MRRPAVLALIAAGACSFQLTAIDDAVRIDVPIDAPIDAPIDGPGDGPAIDAMIDAAIDASTDAPTDAAVDAMIDAPVDAMIDAPIDAMIDAPIDAMIDAPIDAPMIDAPNCPPSFVVLPGAPATSRYRMFGYAQSPSNVVTFAVARQTCANLTGAYLAIPNTAGEVAAFETVSQNPTQSGYWVGITDAAVEGTWRTVLGALAPFLPWLGPPNQQPNGGTAANCAVGSVNALYDVDCAMPYVFICECNP